MAALVISIASLIVTIVISIYTACTNKRALRRQILAHLLPPIDQLLVSEDDPNATTQQRAMLLYLSLKENLSPDELKHFAKVSAKTMKIVNDYRANFGISLIIV